VKIKSVLKCGMADYGCGNGFNIGEQAIMVLGPGFDIPDSFFHIRCRQDAEKYVEDQNKLLDDKEGKRWK